MKLALGAIGAVLLGAAVAGAFVLRGGGYAMYLLALGLVTFFGALPVVLGVITRSDWRGAAAREEADAVVVIPRSAISAGGAAGCGPGEGAAEGGAAAGGGEPGPGRAGKHRRL